MPYYHREPQDRSFEIEEYQQNCPLTVSIVDAVKNPNKSFVMTSSIAKVFISFLSLTETIQYGFISKSLMTPEVIKHLKRHQRYIIIHCVSISSFNFSFFRG